MPTTARAMKGTKATKVCVMYSTYDVLRLTQC